MIDILRLNSEGKLESDVEYFVRLMNIEQSIIRTSDSQEKNRSK